MATDYAQASRQEPQQEPDTEEVYQENLAKPAPSVVGRQLPDPPEAPIKDPPLKTERASARIPFLDDDWEEESDGTLEVDGMSRGSNDSEGFLAHVPSRLDSFELSRRNEEPSAPTPVPANFLDMLADSDDEPVPPAEQMDDPDLAAALAASAAEAEQEGGGPEEVLAADTAVDVEEEAEIEEEKPKNRGFFSRMLSGLTFIFYGSKAEDLGRVSESGDKFGFFRRGFGKKSDEPPDQERTRRGKVKGKGTKLPAPPVSPGSDVSPRRGSLERMASLLRRKGPPLPQSPSATSDLSSEYMMDPTSTGAVLEEEEEEEEEEGEEPSFSQMCNAEDMAVQLCGALYMLVLVLLLTFASLLWKEIPSTISPGAFRYLKQLDVGNQANDAYFLHAKTQTLDLGSADLVYNISADTDHVWHQIELFWQLSVAVDDDGEALFVQPNVVSNAHFVEVAAAEAQVLQNAHWSKLCEQSSEEVRRLCNPGDSLVATVFASQEEPSGNEEKQGITTQITFDGKGTTSVLPVETMLNLIHLTDPSSIQRWLPLGGFSTDGSANERNKLRSVFTFHLPKEVEQSDWTAFVEEELRPLLVSMNAEADKAKLGGKLRVFYKIDGVDYEDFSEAFDCTAFGILAALIAGLPTWLLTRRALLSFGASALSIFTASASSYSSIPNLMARIDGQVTMAMVVAWLAVATSIAELAVSCSCLLTSSRGWVRPSVYIDEIITLWRKGHYEMEPPAWQPPKKLSHLNPEVVFWFGRYIKFYWKVQERRRRIVNFLRQCRLPAERQQAIRKAAYPIDVVTQVFAPAFTWFACCSILTAAASLSNIPLAVEFLHPASMGSALVMIIGPLILPPAVFVSELLSDWHLWQSHCDCCDGDGMALIFPMELGSYPSSKASQKWWRRFSLIFVHKYQKSSACTVVVFFAVLFVIIILTAGQSVSYIGDTPVLFKKGHLFDDGKQVKRAFGGIASPRIVAESMVENGAICSRDAAWQEDNGCAWYHCQGTTTPDVDDDKCQCEYQALGGTCDASARITGLLDEKKIGELWQRLRNMTPANLPPLNIGNASTYSEPPFNVEDWGRAEQIIVPNVRSVLKGVIQSRCWTFRCICGGTACSDSSDEDTALQSSWVALGTGPFSLASNASVAYELPSLNTTMIYMSFGLEKFEDLSALADYDDRAFQLSRYSRRPFNLAEPQYQRDLLAACEGVAPDMEIVSRSCFMKDFRDWLVDTYEGAFFPVLPEVFPARLQEFADKQKQLPEADRKKYFWLSSEGVPVATLASFEVPLKPRGEAYRGVRKRWEAYASNRCRMSVSRAGLQIDWLAGLSLTDKEEDDDDGDYGDCGMWIGGDLPTEESFADNFLSLAITEITGYCSLMVALLALLFTCSPILALVAAASLWFFVIVLLVYGVIWKITQVGIVDLVAVLAAISTSVLPIMRFVTLYSHSHHGPSKRAKSAENEGESYIYYDEWEEPQMEPAPSEERINASQKQFSSLASSEELYLELEAQEFRRKRIEEEKRMRTMKQYYSHASVRSERKNRVAAALRHGTMIFAAVSLSNCISWLTLLFAAPPGLMEVRNTFCLAMVVVPLLGLVLLPIIILQGMSPSRVWTKALANWLGLFTGSRWRFGRPLPEEQHDIANEVLMCAEVLGKPFTWLNGRW
eukprot:CAMPEP_0197629372 /NCGR_PEP_ID=MMETSP1338-20131121/7249_1 /TAXON_ID=43686 ORGANISM="Pelagodinium beii, Strain RCC1491" /NCGR_SAMPLE_ID=MMETSP1338 /ASSEMBLY_ACC=CAM_ASM_000754 /LENGTH=1650 /DNA_ID=CAMNT_0043200407 /DNA_START=79 /DNA_END=5028 /DNA_ORIENTATION=-